MLNHKAVLITGGTGSLGRKLIEIALARYPSIQRLVVFSRDEFKQFELFQYFPYSKFPQLEFVLGDIRDIHALRRALRGIDIVLHTAALKQAITAENNPWEYIQTNIIGSQNIIEASIEAGISKVIAISSDKANAPTSLYGATKLCADKLFLAPHRTKTQFSVIKLGNIIGSRGSVLPFFLEKKKKGVLPITHPEMTRFLITPEECVELILQAIQISEGGEIFVPNIPSFRVIDLAELVCKDCQKDIIGIRTGEKLHEEMLSEAEICHTYPVQNFYVVWFSHPNTVLPSYLHTSQKVSEDFRYHSNQADRILSLSQLLEKVQNYF